MSAKLITKMLACLVTIIIALPAKAAERKYPEVAGLDESIKLCNDSKDAFSITQMALGPMVAGLEVTNSPTYDFCIMVRGIVRDIEYARMLEKQYKNISLTESKFDIATAGMIASFALSNSPIDFSKQNNEEYEKVVKRRASNKLSNFYSITKGIDVTMPNESGDEQVEEAKRIVSEISNLSSKRALLKELINCPVPINERDRVDAKVLSRLIDEEWVAKELRLSYFNKLLMAQEVFPLGYSNDLRALNKSVFQISSEIKEKIENGENYQVQEFKFNESVAAKALDEFLERYDKSWISSVKNAKESFFDSAELGLKCARFKSGVTFDMDVSGFNKLKMDCLTNGVEKNHNYKIAFFRNNFSQYRVWLLTQAKLKADILTKESEILKEPLFLPASGALASRPTGGTKCNRALSDAEMKNARLKTKQVSLEYRAIIAESMKRKMSLKELEREDQRKARETLKQSEENSKSGRGWSDFLEKAGKIQGVISR